MAGARGLHGVESRPALRSRASALARPGPFHPVVRACLDVAVLDAASGRGQAARRARASRRANLAVPWIRSNYSANCTAAARAIPSMAWTTGVETTTGPLGQGIANSVGFAIAQRWLAGHFAAGLRSVRLSHLRPLQRRRHDGGDQLRAGLDRRAFKAVELVLDLRRQSNHDRRGHVARLQRRRRPAVRGLRRGHPRCRRQRPGRLDRGLWKFSEPPMRPR